MDGPGMRFVVFAQGCPHRCKGCHNPQTHDFEGGNEITIDRLLEEIDKDPMLQGVTFSGGEPFCQPESFSALADEIKKRGLGVIAYSGWTFEELVQKSENEPFVMDLLKKCDLLIDGRFEIEKKSLSLLFRGSSNQRIVDVGKTLADGSVIEWKADEV